jgi:glycogen debranching enzyme
MDPDSSAVYPAAPALRAVLNAAIDFGLTREEAWRAFNDALAVARVETVPEYYDAIAGALAQEILSKQRRTLTC